MLNPLLYNTDDSGKSRLSLLIAFLLILFAACEKVIVIDLKDTEPQIVIDGTVTDQPGPYTVKISKTGDYYAPSTFPAVSGATVKIADNTGYSETLQETGNGIYLTNSLQGIPGNTYTLTVKTDGKEYTASSTMPEAMEIDSLGCEYQPGASFGPDQVEGYKLHVYFTDRTGREDYCRFKAFKNGQLIKGYSLYQDKYSDGNSFDYNCFEEETGGIFDLNDTAYVELHTINRATYEYYSTLNNVIPEGDIPPMMQVTPANPNTNFSNGALGCFGAFTVRVDSIIIQ